MAFAVEDFRDLLALLDLHPEWQAELRRRVLSDDLIALPALVRQLAEAQVRTEQRVDALAGAVEALTMRMDALTLAVTELTGEVRIHGVELGTLKGDMLELRYRDRAPAYFSRLGRRLRVLDTGSLADRLDDAVDGGQLVEAERESILLADLVLTGKRREDQADVYLLAELSFGIGPHDVERAVERSALLAKLGLPVLPVVAGRGITPEATELAEELGVWAVVDGRVVSSPPMQPI